MMKMTAGRMAMMTMKATVAKMTLTTMEMTLAKTTMTTMEVTLKKKGNDGEGNYSRDDVDADGDGSDEKTMMTMKTMTINL